MNQKWMAIVAAFVIIIAAVLILRQTIWNPDSQSRPAPTAERIISQIENNPRMPPQAKAAAIAQMRARMNQGGLARPTGTGAGTK